MLYVYGGMLEYFDAGGARLSDSIECSLTMSDLVFNSYDLQKNVDDLNCGLYCVLYAYCKLVKCMTMAESIEFIRKARLSDAWVNL